MTIRIDVRIDGLDKLRQKYAASRITRASEAGLSSALLQVEAEAKDAATRIVYSRPESRPAARAVNKAIKKRQGNVKRQVTQIARSTGRRTGAYRASLGAGGAGNVRRLGPQVASFGSRLSYAGIIEGGSKPHIIRPRTKKALAFWAGGDVIVRKSVKHPGTKARHVLRSAAQTGKGRITSAFARQFWRTLGVA